MGRVIKPKLLIFASGTAEGGGSGFQNLVESAKTGILQAKIVGVVSSYPKGGVWKLSREFNIPFEYFEGPYNKDNYQKIVKKFKAEWIALSGWLKLAVGLDSAKTINIHPAPLPEFGGKGMYGRYVHEAVIKSGVKKTAVTMHFVTEEYDRGPVFFRYPILVRKGDTAEILGERVKKIEYAWQPYITNLVITEKIKWDGKNPKSLNAPKWYSFF
jgi:phosphoribosylglycinamide formyltransferase-1